ncbi:hypothetical protein HH214_09240 [Mucilaginibacter robiniae]|uniref:Uncharacterized protein n=1 Tax=Mucilaginibacter robiniae TaxID=2728022 RepID=A0A7L5E6N3_9SPHI|nr:hypothetical protein [Mucilaginibacter robiniae]QJD96046.1 hypothetical protein HH214_09240 [Mucilaginibacter robiniae]
MPCTDSGRLGGQAAAQAQISIRAIAAQLGIIIAHDIVQLGGAATRSAALGLVFSFIL